jgi:uncharacterized protein (TIGR02145 family)
VSLNYKTMRYLLTFLLITSAFLFSGCTKEQGCTNPEACNFSQSAEEDDGSCYLPGDECDDGPCEYDSCAGCMEENACNYDETAIWEDGSCYFIGDSCDDGNSATINDIWSNTCDCEGFLLCGNDFYHEGYDYSTVQIGEQCWFSENCRYLPEVSPLSASSTSDPYYYVYDYQGSDVTAAQATSNYATYGVLYNWPAVMTEGICPSGWHIPSDGEFTQLTDFLGGESVAGHAMKSTSGWNNNGNGSNSSGFTGLPGGGRYPSGFENNGYNGVWWSSLESGSNSWHRELGSRNYHVVRDYSSKYRGFSARCVRD